MLACAGVLLVAACACAQPPTPAPGARLTVATCTSAERLAQALARLYMDRYPNTTVELVVGNSCMARDLLSKNRADLAIVSDDLDWAAAATTAAPRLDRAPIALDGVAIVVSASNPVRGLSLTQVRDLFSGRTLDWSELGGQPGEVQTVSREPGSGTREVFEARVMAGRAVTSLAIVMPGSQAVSDFVAQDPNGLGYVSTSALSQAVRALSLEGVAPTADTIRSGEYPLSRPLTALRALDAATAVQAFVDLAASAAGQEAAVGAGYASLR